jgi:hypothetical protein
MVPSFIDRGAPFGNTLSPPRAADFALGIAMTPFSDFEMGKASL